MSYDLPEDLILEIFSRLPSKSVLRFRSLSKSLHDCISNPTFIRLHTLRSPKRFTIIHHNRQTIGLSSPPLIYTLHPQTKLSYNASTRVTPHYYPFTSSNVVGSCNGILCVYEYATSIHLWNPSIRRELTVPDPPSSRDRFVLGFGFDPSTDDYKIVRTSGTTSLVYTLKTRAWREIAPPCAASFFEVKSCQCLFNGALHWVVKWYSSSDTLEVSHYDIMRFDLTSEVFSMIELPEPRWKTHQIAIINGCLAVISMKGSRSKRHNGCSRIWVRRECDKTAASWSVAFELNKNPFRGAKNVFQRGTNGDLVFNRDNRIQAYNPDKGVVSNLRILRRSLLVFDVNMCAESLELLDMGTSCDQGSMLPQKRECETRESTM